MFLGVRVVGTCVGGFLDLVEDGLTGYLVSPGDAESLADRIHILLDNPDLAVRMGVEAAERACTRYSVEKIADQYVCCYRNVMALPGGKR
jgi:glycosyltransferase involved in cell wall biosynthesis